MCGFHIPDTTILGTQNRPISHFRLVAADFIGASLYHIVSYRFPTNGVAQNQNFKLGPYWVPH